MDWQRGRYFWARVGYDRVYKATEEDGKWVAEDRGILSLWGKFPLPGEVWLEGRARADLRWIGEEYSTRYRWRFEATREFVVLDHVLVPYVNVEWFYDTRYDGWARTLYQGGFELTLEPALPARVQPEPADGHAPRDVAPERALAPGQGLLLRRVAHMSRLRAASLSLLLAALAAAASAQAPATSSTTRTST